MCGLTVISRGGNPGEGIGDCFHFRCQAEGLFVLFWLSKSLTAMH